MKEKHRYKSSDGIHSINTVIWYPDEEKYKEPVAIVQIVHGMIEYVERYAELAKYLNERGILVVGHDHLGHGDSVNSDDDFGYFSEKKQSEHLVKDVYKLTCIMQKKYPDTPYVILGHSMGSFITRRYLSTYGNDVDCAIIMGTGNQPQAMVRFGRLASKFVKLIHGDRYRSKKLDKLVFGLYNKKVKNPAGSNDWVTADKEELRKYNADKRCTFTFTANGFIGLFDTILFAENKNNIKKIPADLPILMLSGTEDPVGNYGKDVERLFNIYSKYIDDVELKLYAGCRHELVTDPIREEVFKDIYEWIRFQLKVD